MTLLVGALVTGLALSLLALGVRISFRAFNFPDLTADGSFALGGAVAAVMISGGSGPFHSSAAAALAGAAAGALTGILHTKFRVNGILSGILVMTALYSVSLRVMGKSNISLVGEDTVFTLFSTVARRFFPGGLSHPAADSGVSDLIFALATAGAAAAALLWFFKTNLGTAMRAAGDNPRLAAANGIDPGNMIIAGLALSNGLIALSGAALAQYQGFSDIQMGVGMIVWGLGSVVIGEAVARPGGSLALGFASAVAGSVIFRLITAMAIRWGLNPNDLKLVTAVLTLAVLAAPALAGKIRVRHGGAAGRRAA
jgi:putative ABC transport system permease protein